eukprot:TRINITY_DN16748_c0_g1_i1.p1 TRINITY_DN16748_c0_g1~~TRINITY_DN16748_c0_g1_i1.p1  ORF type:complete len:460 (+),score=189.89 TRINITY_DN16748_c0_g1_i1:149-1528(+)
MGLSSYDLYRRIPKDLTAATSQGGILSLGCMLTMCLLVVMEVWDYTSPPIVRDVVMDDNTEPQIQVNFDLLTLEMPCEWVELDVKDRLGVSKVDVIPNVKKEVVDRISQRQYLHKEQPKPKPAPSLGMSNQDMEAAMQEEGESPHLDKASMEKVLKEKKFVFVDFYAPWCKWCRLLAPVWEKFAKEIHDQHYHTAVRKVDCVAHPQICIDNRIRGFPTMRVFKSGQALADYDGKRTAENMLEWVGSITNENEQEHHFRHIEIQKNNQGHLGCRLTGHIMVNRVPGNFHLQAKSSVHSMNPKETNLSHVVNQLSFGEPVPEGVLLSLPQSVKQFLAPLNLKTFVTESPMITFDHYIKVVSTRYSLGWQEFTGYQMQYSNHQYLFEQQHADDDEGKVPEARFSFDFAPTAVVVRYGGKRWYDFITNLCAIVGGVFTVMGLIDRSLHGVRSRIFKESVGKLG